MGCVCSMALRNIDTGVYAHFTRCSSLWNRAQWKPWWGESVTKYWAKGAWISVHMCRSDASSQVTMYHRSMHIPGTVAEQGSMPGQGHQEQSHVNQWLDCSSNRQFLILCPFQLKESQQLTMEAANPSTVLTEFSSANALSFLKTNSSYSQWIT